MRVLLLTSALGLMVAGCASSPTMTRVETGYPTGSLALAAIDRGDWSAAERQLVAARGVSEKDPARLINLARVYAATGRTAEAVAAYRAALASPHHFMVETGDGHVASTDSIARAALARYTVASAD